jgi:hypothetical protein
MDLKKLLVLKGAKNNLRKSVSQSRNYDHPTRGERERE